MTHEPAQWQVRPPQPRQTKVVSVLSGKGGVGKSVLALNLSQQAAAMGLKVLLIDADFHCGNIPVLANVEADRGLAELADQNLRIGEAAVKTSFGFDIIPSGDWQLTEPDAAATTDLMGRIRREAAGYDLIVIDHGSGISRAAVVMAHASDVNLLVLIPEITSIADCYGLYKHISGMGNRADCQLAVNRVETPDEAEYIRTKLWAICECFLGHVPEYAGYVLEAGLFRQSVASQTVLAALDAQSIAVQNVNSLARHLFALFGWSVVGGGSDQENYPKPINKSLATADIRE